LKAFRAPVWTPMLGQHDCINNETCQRPAWSSSPTWNLPCCNKIDRSRLLNIWIVFGLFQISTHLLVSCNHTLSWLTDRTDCRRDRDTSTFLPIEKSKRYTVRD
jgi:hypothetical protein